MLPDQWGPIRGAGAGRRANALMMTRARGGGWLAMAAMAHEKIADRRRLTSASSDSVAVAVGSPKPASRSQLWRSAGVLRRSKERAHRSPTVATRSRQNAPPPQREAMS